MQRCFIASLIFLTAIATPLAALAQQAEPWQQAYTGTDASGDHVIAFWNFEGTNDGVADASGHGHSGTLEGAVRREDGRFGAGIETFAGWPVEDVRHAVRVGDAPELSPEGAFTLELWINPSEQLAGYGNAFLLDKKYVANDDYQWILDPPDGQGKRRMRAVLGFGEDSETWWSDEGAALEAGVWSHVAMTYDGAGTVQFLHNGRSLGGAAKAGRGSVHPGAHGLSIGDRIGSLYSGFPGRIDEVRIATGVREFRPLTVAAEHVRTAYRRMEPDAVLRFRFTNVRRDAMAGLTAAIGLAGMECQTYAIPELAPGASHAVEYTLDTRLRPGEYAVDVDCEWDGADGLYANRQSFPATIVPRRPPHRMPVVMWGVGGVEEVTENTALLKEIGFTHCLGLRCDFAGIWDAGQPVPAASGASLAASYRMLDQAFADDLGVVISLGLGHWLENKPELLRVDREGTPYERKNICGTLPGLTDFSEHVGMSVAQTYGDFPAFSAALINTEVRDGTQVCFHEHDRAAYRAASGLEIPDVVKIKNGVPYADIADFPAKRVVPDDHELLQYYRWFWRAGDGWNSIHSAVNNGLKSMGRDDFWTFFDPAVRVPSLWGSGGSVDFISHWTYSYPDPIRIGLTTDELFAMAQGGAAGQDVMKMTQIIWYRSQTAPMNAAPEGSAPQSAWEDYDPDAAYITIAPMHLKEAFWSKIARPIKGIMYHGWQSLVPTEGGSAYRYTHPETRYALQELVHNVVEPLGPTLLQVPAAQVDVAFLECFTSEMFAGRGTYGWGGSWAGDAYHVLRYAGLQPEIVFEETVQRKGLDGYKVLVLVDCDVLPECIVAAVKAFQQAGGIVVGDERLCPALSPDFQIAVYQRTKNAAEDKAALVARALELRARLGERYQPYVASTAADVLPYRRRFGTSDYVFAVNDRREFGNYVGQHGLVMENGLPASATFTVHRPAGHVYDLLEHREVFASHSGGALAFPVELAPGGGAIYLVTETAIAGIAVAGPDEARRGEAFQLQIAVTAEDGTPVDAVVPVELDVRDPDGRRAEFSGYYGAAGGELAVSITPAPNDTVGVWTVEARERASGRRGRQFYRLVE